MSTEITEKKSRFSMPSISMPNNPFKKTKEEEEAAEKEAKAKEDAKRTVTINLLNRVDKDGNDIDGVFTNFNNAKSVTITMDKATVPLDKCGKTEKMKTGGSMISPEYGLVQVTCPDLPTGAASNTADSSPAAAPIITTTAVDSSASLGSTPASGVLDSAVDSSAASPETKSSGGRRTRRSTKRRNQKKKVRRYSRKR